MCENKYLTLCLLQMGVRLRKDSFAPGALGKLLWAGGGRRTGRPDGAAWETVQCTSTLVVNDAQTNWTPLPVRSLSTQWLWEYVHLALPQLACKVLKT